MSGQNVITKWRFCLLTLTNPAWLLRPGYRVRYINGLVFVSNDHKICHDHRNLSINGASSQFPFQYDFFVSVMPNAERRIA